MIETLARYKTQGSGLFTDFPRFFPLLGLHQEDGEEVEGSRLTCKSFPSFLNAWLFSPTTFFSTRNAITLIAGALEARRCVGRVGMVVIGHHELHR